MYSKQLTPGLECIDSQVLLLDGHRGLKVWEHWHQGRSQRQDLGISPALYLESWARLPPW